MAEPAAPARRTFVDWSLHDETLIRLHGEGKSCSEIANALGVGCTRNAIIGRIHRLGLQRGVQPPHSGKGATGPRKKVLKVPGIAGNPVAVARDGKRAQDKTVRLERMRQQTNFDSGTTRARLAARLDTVPAARRFAEGFEGQTGRVALIDLKEHHCRYPVDQADDAVKYCGLDKREGSSYCAEHHARCCDGIPKAKPGARPMRLPAFNGVAALLPSPSFAEGWMRWTLHHISASEIGGAPMTGWQYGRRCSPGRRNRAASPCLMVVTKTRSH